MIDIKDWHIVARLTKDGLWRVSYREDGQKSFQEILKNHPARFARLLPGHPKPEEYTIVNISPYRMHNRCAEKFRVGRICLAADAAHLCNPWGGLGLTGGFADSLGLAECLVGIATGQADHSILDKYDEVRRSIYHSVIDPLSTANFYRVSTSNPDTVLDEDPFLAMCTAAKNDPAVKEAIDNVSILLIFDRPIMLTGRRVSMTFVMTSHNTITAKGKRGYDKIVSRCLDWN